MTIIEIDLQKLERGLREGRIKVTRGGKTFWRKQRVGRKEEGAKEKPDAKLESERAPAVDNVARIHKQMKTYVKYDKRVTKDMLDSVGAYSSERYSDINSALREGDLGDYADLVDDVNNISEFIQNAPKFKGMVYRGMSEFRNPSDFDDFLEQLIDYDVITLDPFTSCSIEKNVASMFTDAQRNILFEIESHNGILLNGASEIPDENEVLFDHSTEFEIISVNETNGSYVIKLRERLND